MSDWKTLGPWALFLVPILATCFTTDGYVALASHDGQSAAEFHDPSGSGYEVPGLSFQVFVDPGVEEVVSGSLDRAQADTALRTVIDTFCYLNQHRHTYPRFDEAVSKGLLERVIIKPSVHNREGKFFPFLVVRTEDLGRVRLLISASSMREGRYLGEAERFAPVLAREFQWVVSKAETGQKPRTGSIERDLGHAPIRTDKEILALSGEERVRLLQQLFETYLRTIDDQRSLDGQSYYEIGSAILVPPSQPDSATKFYDIRVREALQQIVRESAFLEHTPLAVIGLLNGDIWNVAFVKIEPMSPLFE